MDADLDTLATALYVFTDDVLRDHPERVPPASRRGGIAPKLSHAELLTLAVLQALLGFTSEHRWIRYADAHLRSMFPELPQQPGYNKRLRRLADTMAWLVGRLGAATSIVDDTVWVVDSTPGEVAARERPRNAQTWPAGPATATAPRTPGSFGVCGCICSAPCTGCPSGAGPTGAKADERHALTDILTGTPALAERPGQILIGDKNYYGLRPGRTRRRRDHPAPPDPRRGDHPARRTVLQTPAPDHRVSQRHPQRPTRPRTPRRPHHRRSLHPDRATPPRPHRRDLAQRPHRPNHPPIPDRLRPLTPGIIHLGVTHADASASASSDDNPAPAANASPQASSPKPTRVAVRCRSGGSATSEG